MKTVEQVQREHIDRLIRDKEQLTRQLAKARRENRDLRRCLK